MPDLCAIHKILLQIGNRCAICHVFNDLAVLVQLTITRKQGIMPTDWISVLYHVDRAASRERSRVSMGLYVRTVKTYTAMGCPAEGMDRTAMLQPAGTEWTVV